jgi:hypothetical protein
MKKNGIRKRKCPNPGKGEEARIGMMENPAKEIK